MAEVPRAINMTTQFPVPFLEEAGEFAVGIISGMYLEGTGLRYTKPFNFQPAAEGDLEPFPWV